MKDQTGQDISRQAAAAFREDLAMLAAQRLAIADALAGVKQNKETLEIGISVLSRFLAVMEELDRNLSP